MEQQYDGDDEGVSGDEGASEQQASAPQSSGSSGRPVHSMDELAPMIASETGVDAGVIRDVFDAARRLGYVLVHPSHRRH